MQNIRKIKAEIQKQANASLELLSELRNVCDSHAVHTDPEDIVATLMIIVKEYQEKY